MATTSGSVARGFKFAKLVGSAADFVLTGFVLTRLGVWGSRVAVGGGVVFGSRRTFRGRRTIRGGAFSRGVVFVGVLFAVLWFGIALAVTADLTIGTFDVVARIMLASTLDATLSWHTGGVITWIGDTLTVLTIVTRWAGDIFAQSGFTGIFGAFAVLTFFVGGALHEGAGWNAFAVSTEFVGLARDTIARIRDTSPVDATLTSRATANVAIVFDASPLLAQVSFGTVDQSTRIDAAATDTLL